MYLALELTVTWTVARLMVVMRQDAEPQIESGVVGYPQCRAMTKISQTVVSRSKPSPNEGETQSEYRYDEDTISFC